MFFYFFFIFSCNRVEKIRFFKKMKSNEWNKMAADRILATCALVQVLSVGVLIGQFYWRHTTKQRTHPRHGHRYIACSTVQDPMISCRTPPLLFASAGPSPCVTHDLCADADLLARFKLTRIFDCF